eukprot:Lankesteria_metandrocarpae@DN5222_c0_g1_i1.p1
MSVMALPGGVEVFEDPHFDVKQYLNEHRKTIPLFQLRNAADVEVHNVKGQIVKLINENYNEFINVATELHRVSLKFSTAEEFLNQLHSTAFSSAAKVEQICKKVEDILAVKTDSERAIRKKRALLESIHCLSVIEARLDRVESGEWFLLQSKQDTINSSSVHAIHNNESHGSFAAVGASATPVHKRSGVDIFPGSANKVTPEVGRRLQHGEPTVSWQSLSRVALSTFVCHCGLIEISTEDLQRVNSVLEMLEESGEKGAVSDDNEISNSTETGCSDEQYSDVVAMSAYKDELRDIQMYWSWMRTRCLSLLKASIRIAIRLSAQGLLAERNEKSDAHYSNINNSSTVSPDVDGTANADINIELIGDRVIDVLFSSMGPLHKSCRDLDCTDYFIEICKTSFVQSAIAYAVENAKKAEKLQAVAVADRSTEFHHFITTLHDLIFTSDAPFSVFVKKLRRVVCGVESQYDEELCHRIYLVSEALAYPVIQCISERYTGACVPVFSAVFVADYNAMLHFFSAACELMHFEEVLQFRCSKRLMEFQYRWKTQACYTLRVRDLRSKMRKAAGITVYFDEKFMYQGQVFWMKQSVEIVRQIVSLFSPATFIDRDLPNALRYVAELVSGYVNRVRRITEVASLQTVESKGFQYNKQNAQQHTVVDGTIRTFSKDVNNLQKSSSGNLKNTATQSSNNSHWRTDLTLPHIGYVIADILGLLNLFDTDDNKQPSLLLKPLQTHINALLSPEYRVTLDDVRHSPYRQKIVDLAQSRVLLLHKKVNTFFRECASSLAALQMELETYLLDAVCRSTIPQLAGLHGVPPLFRMTNKPPPTEASPYVNATLMPLEDFYETSAAVVSPLVLDGWITGIVDRIAEEFGRQAESLLSAVLVQGESLKRLQKQTQTLVTDASPVTDVDKIHLQIRLDVSTFVQNCLQRFRLTPAGRNRLLAVEKAINILTNEAWRLC